MGWIKPLHAAFLGGRIWIYISLKRRVARFIFSSVEIIEQLERLGPACIQLRGDGYWQLASRRSSYVSLASIHISRRTQLLFYLTPITQELVTL